MDADYAPAWIAAGKERQGLARLLAAIRTRFLAFALILLLSVGAAALYLSHASKVYQAEADLLVSPIADDAGVIGLSVLRQSADPSRDMETVARLVTTPDVARRATELLRVQTPVGALLTQVTARPVAQSNLVAIQARAATPAAAAALANAFGTAIVRERTNRLQRTLILSISRLQDQISRLRDQPAAAGALAQQLSQLETLRSGPDPTLTLETTATPPTGAVSPRPMLSIFVALVGGGLLGLLAVLGLEQIDRTIRSEDQLRAGYRLPVIARVPAATSTRPWSRWRSAQDGPVVPMAMTREARDAFIQLQAAVTATTNVTDRAQLVLVTGPSKGEGKSTAAASLGWALSVLGERVILVEGDLRRPSLGRALGVAAETGFESVLAGRADVRSALVKVPATAGGLHALLGESPVADAPESMSDDGVASLIESLESMADWIVIDTPPLQLAPELISLARLVDQVLLVVRLGVSDLTQLSQLTDLLAQQRIVPAGFVVVGGRTPAHYRAS